MNLHKGEFWDVTENAFRGCSHASRGCDNCWALRMAWRHAHNPKTKAQYAPLVTRPLARYPGRGRAIKDGTAPTKMEFIRTGGGDRPCKYYEVQPPAWTGKTTYDPAWAAKLRAMKKRKRVFLNGMGDMFHEANKPADIQHCLDTISGTPQHLFIVATKRPAIALYHLRIVDVRVIPNLILLTSTEDQLAWDTRLPYLIDCKPYVAAVGAIAEPLLDLIDLRRLHEIDWLIAGGETGHGARSVTAAAFRYFRNDCEFYKVPYFFKQYGGRFPGRGIEGYTCNGGPTIWKTWG